MTIHVRRSVACVFASAAFLTAAAAPSMAQNQDGLINVAVGDVTILEDVRVALAAQVAANICGVKVGPVAVLGRAVDRSGAQETVCRTGPQEVRLEQN